MRYRFNSRDAAWSLELPGLAAALWLGLVIGVSFVATPVKFQAPSLDLPTALDVGRVTFALANKVEWGMWVLLGGSILLARRRRDGVGWGLLGLILAAQTFWLLPILDERVGRIIAGLTVAPAPHHHIYVALEGLKALTLIILIAISLRRPVRGI